MSCRRSTFWRQHGIGCSCSLRWTQHCDRGELGTKITDPRSRREELLAAMDQASAQMPSDAELSALRAQIDDALANGATPASKALLLALVQEMRAESRDKIVPCFRVRGGEPGEVRPLGGSAPRGGLEPAAYCLGGKPGPGQTTPTMAIQGADLQRQSPDDT
jgi:hypothetical protein